MSEDNKYLFRVANTWMLAGNIVLVPLLYMAGFFPEFFFDYLGGMLLGFLMGNAVLLVMTKEN